MSETASPRPLAGLTRLTRAVGRACLNGVDAVGGMAIFMVAGLAQIFTNIRIIPRTVHQLYVR